MQFTSFAFLLFLPIVAIVFFVLPKKMRFGWLLLVSLFFYAYWKVKYTVFLLIAISITFCGALLLQKLANNKRAKKWVLFLSIMSVFSFLLFFKYYNFTAETANSFFKLLGFGFSLPFMNLLMPIGISFYTFQSVSYLIDVYRGQISAEKNLFRYALFVSFFPQIFSGPIGRAPQLLPQLKTPANFVYSRVKNGLLKMGWGFFLKLIVADRLSAIVANCFGNIANYSGFILLVAVFIFAIQIYCDFSSYSCIAIGAAKIFGIELNENFNLPYFSNSIPEFWRRWHITLGSWFKDYLFYPLMRSPVAIKLRKFCKKIMPKYYAQNMPTILALLLVWLSTGLWHGASWNYVVWGLFHGLLIIFGILFAPTIKKINKKLHIPVQSKGFKLLQIVRTFLLVCIAYVFFRAPSFSQGMLFFRNLFSEFNPWVLFDGTLYTLGLDRLDFTIAIIGIIIVFLVDIVKRSINIISWIERQEFWLRWSIYLIGIISITIFGYYGPEYDIAPFIYFQF